MINERRNFLKQIGAGAATAAAAGAAIAATPVAGPGVVAVAGVAAPAVMTQPAVKWRLASSFPKSLDTIFGGATDIAQKLSELTGGRFIIEVNAPGVLAPAFGVLDPVTKGDFECCHTAPYYFYPKDPTFALDSAIPFGMGSRLLTAFYHDGPGRKLFGDFYARKYNIVAFPAGNTGTQMGGWYKRELKTIPDLMGLKGRFGGFAGTVLTKLGVVNFNMPAGEIAANLESGKIDAAEFVGPYDDEKLGLQKTAPYYYYPGWWEGSTQIDLFVNKQAHEALSPEFKAALEMACSYAHLVMQARYDARNGEALKRLIKGGTKMRRMPQTIMDASYAISQDIFSDLNKTNPEWAKIYPAYAKFQKDGVEWFRYAENTYDSYMSRVLVR